MQYHKGMIGVALALSVATSGSTIVPRLSPGSLYVRARAAELAGDSQAANAGFAALLAQDPASARIANRAYRQAISTGDMPLALRSAHLLDAKGALPLDAAPLLVVEQIRARNWGKAREAVERLGRDRVFGFLAPYCRAWIALGSGSGDPIALVDAARGNAMAAPYLNEQRNLLLIAMGRGGEVQPSGTPSPATVSTGVSRAEDGVGLLLAHVSADFARQRLTPLALVMARIATYSAPQFASGWLLLADLLRTVQRPDLALAALANVRPKDALASSAESMRIGLLNDAGQRDKALREALVAAGRDGAGADDWARVGDLYMAMDRPADAAKAYTSALQVAETAKRSNDLLWPLLLQQGAALDQAGDWQAAKRALDRAYAIAPDQAIVLNQVGYSRIDHGEDIPQASAMIAQASKLQPDDPAITDSLGWVLFLQGKPQEAVPLLERAAAKSPGESTINEHLGDVYWALGRQYEARYAWRAALITATDKDNSRLRAKIDTGPSGTTAAP